MPIEPSMQEATNQRRMTIPFHSRSDARVIVIMID
jgi:hypothetical protein